MGEGIGIVDNDPAMNASLGRHLADEEGDGAADGLDASILFRAELEGFQWRLGMGAIVLEKRS